MTFKLLTRAYFVLLAGVLALGIIQPGAVMAEIAVESEIEFELESFMDISGDYTISSVSVSGDYAVVGSKFFKKEGDAWTYQATLEGWGPVSISGDYAIAGDKIFKREGDSWNQQTTLTPEYPVDDGFGYAASISGDYAIVGAPNNEENGERSGAAYIFKREGDTWMQQIKLMPKDGGIYDMFGFSVSLSGDYAIVGTFGLFSSGSVYIFKRNQDTWEQQSRLSFRGDIGDLTPVTSTAISGDYAIVGIPVGSGATYIFKRKGGTWIQLNKLVPGNPSESHFGVFVGLSDDYAIVQADGYTTYIHPISDLGETLSQEVSGDSPVYFDFSDDLGSGQSSIAIIPTGGSGNISVTQYADALESLPEAVSPIGPVYDIDGSEYTSESGTTVAFSWDTPLPDVGGLLLVSTDGENWIDAATDPGISDIEWNLDSPPYSVSFTTTHFSKWAIVTDDPVTDLSTAADLVGKENDGGVEFVRNDVNEDGIVDIFDVLFIIDQNEAEADTDAEKEAVRNFSETLTLMGAEDDGTPEFAETDANGDGAIDVFDMLYFIDRMNETN